MCWELCGYCVTFLNVDTHAICHEGKMKKKFTVKRINVKLKKKCVREKRLKSEMIIN